MMGYSNKNTKDDDNTGKNGRPVSSGTIDMLKSSRRQASQNLQKAQRAERAYKAKKGATAARNDYAAAKESYKQSAHHFKQGFLGTGRLFKQLPFIIRERNEKKYAEASEKRTAKALKQKQELEERLAREAAMAPEEPKK